MPTTLPYITNDLASEPIRKQFDDVEKIFGNVPPLMRILANVPSFMQGFLDLAGPIFAEQGASIDLKLLAILRTAEINNCNYCRGYYAGMAEQMGIVGEKRQAVNAGDMTSKLFNEKEAIVMQLATEMTQDVQAPPATVEKAKAILGLSGTLEIMMVVGLFNLINRVARTSGLPID
jgi:alkylhydroperoxidase family enzyme